MNFAALLIYATCCLAATLLPKRPTQDQFYNAPSNFESQPLGTILKVRNVPNPLTSVVTPVKVKNAWQLLVRSEDTFGNPNAIVTTIVEPFAADKEKVVSYQAYEDSGKLDCSPSYAIQYGSDISTIATQAEMYFVAALLEQGYYVVIPDYEGPKSAFTVGVQAGRATLNSIRAALASHNTTGISPAAKVVMWGYSGGSLASGWASALQPQYAPELGPSLLGAALGGFVTNITATAVATDGTPFAGIVANALAGLTNEYSELKTFLNQRVSPLLSVAFQGIDDHCLADSLVAFFGHSFFNGPVKYFRDGWNLMDMAPAKSIIEANGLIYQPKQFLPKIPIFIYHGTLDRVVPLPNSKTTFEQWCSWGLESGEFNEDASNGHITETIVGAPAALTWITRRFNGEQPVSGCIKSKRLSNFEYPGIAPSVLEYFKSALKAVTGAGLGSDLTKDQISLPGLLALLKPT
ncbi:uncharacterized protein LODBEIA_P41780 [Lodderomyces beijingensis]|uniref:Triacylglycerol lipase n=1 Tax=Lodderomyces beijingensis TaxID=1775926 RepID=A0ABP0ZP69_9ASCO